MVMAVDSRPAPVARQEEGGLGEEEGRSEVGQPRFKVILVGKKSGGISRLRAGDWVLGKFSQAAMLWILGHFRANIATFEGLPAE